MKASAASALTDAAPRRAARLEDLPAIADLHLAAFADSALTRLGREATRRYYGWLLTGPHESVALVACSGPRIAGFCFGGSFNGAMTGYLRKNRAFLVGQVLRRPWLLGNPLLRERFARGVRLLTRRRRPMGPANPAKPKSFGILAIAVHPDFRRGGIGRLLMDDIERVARDRGFAEMDLSVHPANDGAVRFYETLAWRKTAAGEWKGTMKKTLV